MLIGMPAAGKSTVGVLVAKRGGYGFMDTDLEIQAREGRSLQSIIDRDGTSAFRAIEESYVTAIECSGTVVSTGGSVVYSDASMRHLRDLGTVVYLETDLAEIEQRIGDLSSRGLVRRDEQSLADLHAERDPLYRRWAELTIDCRGKTQEEVAAAVLAAI